MNQLTNAPSALSPVWTHLTHMRPVRGEGAWLVDEAGERWLDFASGIGVASTGHAHPRVVEAVRTQAERLFFGQINNVITPQAEALAGALDEITPPGLDRFFLSNSGAEAIEGAVKLARHATGRTNLIVFQGGFHGRTAQTMAMTTGKTVYRHKYQPLPGGISVAPFPYPLQLGMGETEAVSFCLERLELVLQTQTAPDETAAMVIEPVLGEGGYVPAPPRFLQGVRELCDRHGIVLVLDEIQTGFGRTGKMFAFEHAGVVPDVLVMAKGMGSGFPISAIGAPAALMERWEVGTHGGTYGGGNAVVLAAAEATLRTLREEALPANAEARGREISAALHDMRRRVDAVAEVRGPGLMIGVEFRVDGQPAPEAAKAVQRACLEERMLLLTCGSHGHVVRWIPPLVIGDAEVARALEVFERALARV